MYSTQSQSIGLFIVLHSFNICFLSSFELFFVKFVFSNTNLRFFLNFKFKGVLPTWPKKVNRNYILPDSKLFFTLAVSNMGVRFERIFSLFNLGKTTLESNEFLLDTKVNFSNAINFP